MTSETGLTRADLAARLGVSVSALRKWEEAFGAWLVTPKGTKGYAAPKVYDPQDVRVLSLVKRMRQEGLTVEQIQDQLSDRLSTATEEVSEDLPLVQDKPQQVQLQSYVDLLGRYQATEGQMVSLTEERDYLRQRLADMEDKLLETQARAAAAEGKLDLLQQMGLGLGSGHSETGQDETPPAASDETPTASEPTKGFWSRFLGR